MTERGEAVPFLRRWRIWALAAAALAAAGSVFHFLWPMPQAGIRDEPPLIKARQEPLRIRPETPGGMKIPDQERNFFRHLEGRSPPRVERLVPPPPLGPHGEDVSEPPASPPRPASSGKSPQAHEAAPPKKSSPAAGLASVQLGALASEGAVRRAWAELRARHGDLLGSLSLIVERAASGDGGTALYRMRAGPVATPGAAKALCASLKARGQDCLAVGR